MALGEKRKLEIIKILKNRLDEYIQKKSDFLSEITTEPITTTKPAFFYRGIILPFVENTLLMDNLAANEGVRYQDQTCNRLRIRVLIKGKELKAKYTAFDNGFSDDAIVYTYPEELPYTFHCHHYSNTKDDAALLQILNIENGDCDKTVELPGPLGEFAFYSFLENFIRNAAKHNKGVLNLDLGKKLEITVCLSARLWPFLIFEKVSADRVS